MAMDLAEAVVTIRADMAGFQRQLNSVKVSVDRGSTDMSTMLSTRLTGAAKQAAAGMGLYLGASALGGFVKGTIAAATGFEQSMANVKAISGATGLGFEAMGNAAKEMGRTTQYTAIQSADALQFLAMAGLDATEAVKALPEVLNLAAAGGIDIATAADLATNVMGGMRLEVQDLAHVNDVLAFTTSKTNTNIVELSNAMRIAGPVAAGMGQNIEEVAAVLGGMANQGIKAENAGQGLKQMFARLMVAATGSKDALDANGESVGKAGDALSRLGVSLLDESGKLRNMSDILTDLRVNNMSASDAMDIFGKYTYSTALAAVSASDKMTKVRDAMVGVDKAAEGAAERMKNIRLETFGGAVTLLQSALESYMISLGDAVIKSEEVNNAVKSMAAIFTDAAETVARTGSIFGEWKHEVTVAADVAGVALVGFAGSRGIGPLLAAMASLRAAGTLVAASLVEVSLGGAAAGTAFVTSAGVIATFAGAAVAAGGSLALMFHQLELNKEAVEAWEQSLERGRKMSEGMFEHVRDRAIALKLEGKELTNLKGLVQTGLITAQQYYQIKADLVALEKAHVPIMQQESAMTKLLGEAQAAVAQAGMTASQKKVAQIKADTRAEVDAVRAALGKELANVKLTEEQRKKVILDARKAIALQEEAGRRRIAEARREEIKEEKRIADEKVRTREDMEDRLRQLTMGQAEYEIDAAWRAYEAVQGSNADKELAYQIYGATVDKVMAQVEAAQTKASERAASDIKAEKDMRDQALRSYADSFASVLATMSDNNAVAWQGMAEDAVKIYASIADKTQATSAEVVASVANAHVAITNTQKGMTAGAMSRDQGILAGVAAGAATGAAIGSYVSPGYGTAIGAVIGGVAGGVQASMAPGGPSGARGEFGLGERGDIAGDRFAAPLAALERFGPLFNDLLDARVGDMAVYISRQVGEIVSSFLDLTNLPAGLADEFSKLADVGFHVADAINTFGQDSYEAAAAMADGSAYATQLSLDLAAGGQAASAYAQAAMSIAMALNQDGLELVKNIGAYDEMISRIATVDARTRGLTNATQAQALADNILANASLFSVEQLQQAAAASKELTDISAERKDITTQLADADSLSAAEIERLQKRLAALNNRALEIETGLTGMNATIEETGTTAEATSAKTDAAFGENGMTGAVNKMTMAIERLIQRLSRLSGSRYSYTIEENRVSTGATTQQPSQLTQNAKGNVFTTPQFFGFNSGRGRGLGVLGEAGAEGVFPLTRMADGSLGVRTSGGGGGASITVNVEGSLVTEGQLVDTIATALNNMNRERYT